MSNFIVNGVGNLNQMFYPLASGSTSPSGLGGNCVVIIYLKDP